MRRGRKVGVDDDIEHIRQGIEDLRVSIAVHDSKSAQYVERLVEAQERSTEAVTKVAEHTEAMSKLVLELRKNNGGRLMSLDSKTVRWLIAIGLAGAIALGGGQELVSRL